MKKEITTCDICGTIIRGPNGKPRGNYGKVYAAIPLAKEYHKFHHIDVCVEESEEMWDVFEGNVMVVFGGGSDMIVHEGEMIDLTELHPVMVLDNSPVLQTTAAYALDDLSPKQRQYIDEAEEAIRMTWQQKLDNHPDNVYVAP